MKKILYLGLILGLSLLSGCSDQDEDPIIGTWQLTSRVGEGALSECQQQSTRQFSSDNRYIDTFFEDAGENCNRVRARAGTWNSGEGSFYVLISDDGALFVFDVRFNGNTFTLEELDQTGNTLVIETYTKL